MADAPEVSVVIPTFNRSTLVIGAVACALDQQEVDVEVIVVDDGSRDETPARLAAIADPRLRVVRHPDELGIAQTRNRGIREARSEWIAFLDDDDAWAPRKLRTQLDAARAAGASFAYASAVKVDDGGRVFECDYAPDPDDLARCLFTVSDPLPAGCSNVLARTELLRALGGFDERLFQLADWDMWLRMIDAGSAVACPEVLAAHLHYPGNMLLRRRARDMLDEFDQLAVKHRDSSAARGLEFDGAYLAQWLATRLRWAGRRTAAARVFLDGARRYRRWDHVLRALYTLGRPRAARPPERPVWSAELVVPVWLVDRYSALAPARPSARPSSSRAR